MVLYTVNSLLVQGAQAIIGMTLGDHTYGVLDLLCNKTVPSLSQQTGLNSYTPEPSSILIQNSCIECMQHGDVQGKFYSELIASKTITTTDVILIDTTASSWEPLQESILTAWMDYIQDGYGEDIPFAYSVQRGTEKHLSHIYKLIAKSAQNVILTAISENHTLVKGFRVNNHLYSANDCVSNQEVYRALSGLIGSEPSGYVTLLNGKLVVHCTLEGSTKVLQIPAQEVADVLDLASMNYQHDQGVNIETILDSCQDMSTVTFSSIDGDAEAIAKFRRIQCPRIYTVTNEGTTSIYAAYIGGKIISLLDICRIQAAYEKVASCLNVEDIPCLVTPNLTMQLLLTEDMLASGKVIFRDHSILSNGASAITERLQSDYTTVTEIGISTEPITSKITLPSTRNFLLTHFKILRGEFSAIENYNNIYAQLYPTLNSEVQDSPTAFLSRSLPTYQQLKEIYSSYSAGQSEQSDSDTNTDAESEEDTTFFVDELTGVSNTTMSLTDYSQLDMSIDLHYMPLTKIFSYYDCVNYKNAIAVTGANVDPALIEGNANNNTLGVMENELKFYLGLRNLVIYGICVENGIYTIPELEASLAAGVRSSIVDGFLENLAEDAFALNWVHTGHVLTDTYASSDSEDGEEEDSISAGLPGRYTVSIDITPSGARQEKKVYEKYNENEFQDSKSRLAGFQSGMPRIVAYTNLEVKNPFAWIETAIRLLRWGERKPNALYVPSLNEAESGPRFLDMQTLIISSFSGTFTNAHKRTYGENEAPYIVDGAINFNVTDEWTSDIAEVNSNIGCSISIGDEIPCGVMLSSTFEDVTDQTQHYYIDVFTLASQLSKSQIKVYGVSYDAGAGEFICDADAKPVVIAGNPPMELDYTPESFYGDNVIQLWTALTRLESDPIVFSQSKCAFLVKYLRIMDEKLKGFETSKVSVFDLIKLCATVNRWDCITECEQLIAIASNDERRDKAAQIRAAYGLNSMNDIMTWMIFIEAVRPFLLLAERMRGKPKTLASILKEALTLQAELDSHVSSARSMGASAAIMTFEQMVSKCIKYYKVKHPLTGEDSCYAGLVDNTPNSKIVIWTKDDLSRLPDVQFEEVSLIPFYKKWVYPVVEYYKKATNPKDMAARKQYQAQLDARFIQAKPQTFSTILKICVDFSKQQKAQS